RRTERHPKLFRDDVAGFEQRLRGIYGAFFSRWPRMKLFSFLLPLCIKHPSMTRHGTYVAHLVERIGGGSRSGSLAAAILEHLGKFRLCTRKHRSIECSLCAELRTCRFCLYFHSSKSLSGYARSSRRR